MSNQRRTRVLIITLSGGLVACAAAHDNSSSRAEASMMTSESSEALCTTWAQLQCAGEHDCCDAPGRTRAECEAALQTACEQNVYLDQVAGNQVSGYDRGAADSAFSELRELAAACNPEVASWNVTSGSLRAMFRGTLGAEQSCKPADAATAAQSTLAAALVSCRLADDLACLPASLLGDWTCLPKQARGGTCLSDENCDANTYCDSSQDLFGTCHERLPIGAACTTASECASFACSSQLCVKLDQQSAWCPQP